MRISVYRKAHFNAAHRLHNKKWSDEQNKQHYGKCNNPYYHGHNYEVEVRLTGEVDPESGFLFDLGVLKDNIKENIEDRYDHRNLNEELPEFKDVQPSAEYICFNIHKILREVIDDKFDIGVKLWETPRNYVEYPALH